MYKILLAVFVSSFLSGPLTAFSAESELSELAGSTVPESRQARHMMMEPGPLSISENREASGTAWQPDSTPMYAIRSMADGWRLMGHGSLFAGYGYQGSERGGEQPFSVDWLMLIAKHAFLGGEFGARAMLSLEAPMLGKRGYPLLLQTGESANRQPLHDRQHPHDLFMETSLTYSRELFEGMGFQIYGAPAGEPALGPVAFPHRLSASSDPLAPLGHHWEDSSHITYGVVTAGLFTRYAKLEASWFNGREPDENRYDFDFRNLDSYSVRLAVNPDRNLSGQVSYGFLKSPEALDKAAHINRITASATYNLPLAGGGNWATTALWGINVYAEEPSTNASLLETDLNLDGANTLFARVEAVQKTGGDLVLPSIEPTPPLLAVGSVAIGSQPGSSNDKRVFDVGSFVVGYLHDFGALDGITVGLGVRGSINVIGERLSDFYGTKAPGGFAVYLRLRPARMAMAS